MLQSLFLWQLTTVQQDGPEQRGHEHQTANSMLIQKLHQGVHSQHRLSKKSYTWIFIAEQYWINRIVRQIYCEQIKVL